MEENDSLRVAFLASTSGVNDGTLCETEYKTLVAYCQENNIPFRYYQHTKENLVESEIVIDAAVADGYNFIIASDYSYASAIAIAQQTYPEIKFVILDASEADFNGTPICSNTTCVTFKSEISAFFAGYAAVAMGYKHIGYLGGMAIPSVVAFETGFIQGADYAARERGIEGVVVEAVMANQFYGDSDITAYMDTWYKNLGVQCVFSCGGAIYTSNAEAAAKVGGKTIGVDSDQKAKFDEYAKDMCITSALKNLKPALITVLDETRAGHYSFLGGKTLSLGLASQTDPELNYVGIPLETTQWSDSFTKEDYMKLISQVYSGEIQISTEVPTADTLYIKFNDCGNIK